MHVGLQPEQAQRLQPIGQLAQAFGAEAEVDVQHQAHVRPRPFAEGLQEFDDRIEQGRITVAAQLKPRPEARIGHPRPLAVEQHRVGLQRPVAAPFHLGAQLTDVSQVAHRLAANVLRKQFWQGRAERAAVGPVERNALAHRSAEQPVDRQSRRLAGDVQAAMLDGGDGLVHEAAGGHAGLGPEVGADPRPCLRIPADHPLGQLADDAAEAGVPARLVELRPADQALVGGQLQERDRPPAAIRVQVLKAGDAHGSP